MHPQTNRRRTRLLLRALLWTAVAWAMFRWFEHKQVYHPSRRLDASGAQLSAFWRDVYFASASGPRLNGWYFPALSQSNPRSKVILFCHGNAGNIGDRLESCRVLAALHTAIFIFDYRGYGRSKGFPSEAGTYRDAVAAYDWLLAEGFAAEDIVLFGESLGGAVATELASRRPVAGLILASTFLSIPEVGRDLFPWLPVGWLATIRYDTRSKLPRLHIPILIMHSRSDSIIPYRHALGLLAAANEPKSLWELRTDHNDAFLLEAEHCQAGIRRFLESLTL